MSLKSIGSHFCRESLLSKVIAVGHSLDLDGLRGLRRELTMHVQTVGMAVGSRGTAMSLTQPPSVRPSRQGRALITEGLGSGTLFLS